MRVNQEANKTNTYTVSGLNKNGKETAEQEELKVSGLQVKEKKDSDDKPKSLMEKLIAQKKKINEQMNDLQKYKAAGELKMTDKQIEEMKKELTAQLSAVDQALSMESDRIQQEQKDIMKDQQGKKQAEAGKKDNLSMRTEDMTAKEIVAENMNKSIVSASGGLDNLKLVNHVNRTGEQRKNIVEGELRLSLMNGGSIEGKMDELNEYTKKMQAVSNEILDIALAPMKDIILKEKKETTVEEESDRSKPLGLNLDEAKDRLDRVTQIEHREMSNNLPNNVNNDINYLA